MLIWNILISSIEKYSLKGDTKWHHSFRVHTSNQHDVIFCCICSLCGKGKETDSFVFSLFGYDIKVSLQSLSWGWQCRQRGMQAVYKFANGNFILQNSRQKHLSWTFHLMWTTLQASATNWMPVQFSVR